VAVPPVLLVLGCLFALGEVLRRRDERFLFLLCWIVLPIAIFSLIPSRLTWYIASTYPAMAVLSGGLLGVAFRLLATSGVRWWKGRSPFSWSIAGSGAVLAGGFFALGQHHLELVEILLNPMPRAKFDTLVEEMRSSVAAAPVAERRLLVYRNPALARNETVYRDFLANRIVPVADEAALRTELGKGLGDYLLADPHHFAAVQRIRPLEGYAFLAPYKVRTDWLFFATFSPVVSPSGFVPSKQVIHVGSEATETLFGWGKRDVTGGITVRRSLGARSAIAFDSDLAHRELGADLSINLARSGTLRGLPLNVEVRLNEQPIGQFVIRSSQLNTVQVGAPKEFWRTGRNVISFHSNVEGRELAPGDEALIVNWVSIKLR
jgi:hypothetical protein